MMSDKEDLNQESEEEISKDQEPKFCAASMKVPMIIVGAMIVLVLVWAVFVKNDPSASEVAQSWGEPEKTYKVLQHMGGAVMPAGAVQAVTPLPPGAFWRITPPHGYKGSCHNCHPFTRGSAGARAPMMKGKPAAFTNMVTPLPSNARRTVVPPHPERGPCHSCHPYSPKAAPVANKFKTVLIKEVGMTVGDTAQGVFVAQVYKNSWADKGGVMHGDIIAGFDHRRVKNLKKLQKLVLAANPEKTVAVKVKRGEKTMKLNVMIGEGELEGVTIPTPALPAAMQRGMGRMGGYGLGPGGYVVCPGCGFKMLHQRGVPAYSLSCPKCGGSMVKEELLNNQAQQANLVQGQGNNPWCPTR
ncbi:PDZ domain-containing protein [Elusimicrobiota bacterium]